MNEKIKAILLLILLVVLSYLFSDFYSNLDQQFMHFKYRIRGELKPDSTTVILYLDNDDLIALGGLPLRRNYYALAIEVLAELGAKAIGLNVALTEKDKNHPDYDDILVNVISKRKNVVLTSYFDILSREGPNLTSRLPEGVGIKLTDALDFYSGENLNLPFDGLIGATEYIGHENIIDENRIPLFIAQKNGMLPSFGFELLRAFLDVKKEDMTLEKSCVKIKSGKELYVIPYEKDGTVNLNFLGGSKELNAIPLVEFLQAYNLTKKGGISDINVNIVKDKIVIIGIVATGRSPFVITPFKSQFPAVGLHTFFVDNALNNRFIISVPVFIEIILLIGVGTLFSILIIQKSELKIYSYFIGYLFIYLIISIILFSKMNIDLGVSRHLIVLFVQLSVIFGYKHYQTKEKISDLEIERDIIRKRLHEREEKLHKLQEELQQIEKQNEQDKREKIIQEIRKYEDEVNVLRGEINRYEDIINIEIERTSENFEGIIFNPKGKMKEVVDFVRKISDNDAPALILGESGTGKELVARAIHRTSKRADKPFIALNCGALTETLLESELFGYEKGAFTGAIKEKPGRFELANGGTIFLDEIAETSEAFQVKLLRVLQEGEFERVGGTETRKVDVRVVAATNRDIFSNSNDKKFRQDLYYRLSVFVVNLPPLRERKEDIPILTKYFLEQENKNIRLTQDILEIFLKYPWNGNIRELQSVIKRAVVLATSDHRDFINVNDLPAELREIKFKSVDLAEQILDLLRKKGFSKNSISETARELGGLNRSTVAEYFKGYCFKIFVEKEFNLEEAVKEISNDEDEVKKRVKKKITEYIKNALEFADKTRNFEENLKRSRSKFKNLPHKYHIFLEEIIKKYDPKDLQE